MLRGDSVPERIDLDPAQPIDEAITSWRSRLRDDGRDPEELGRDVARLVWRPLEARVGGIRTVLVAPDGDTCFLPWGALPDGEDGSFLLRRYAFGILQSGRQLVALARRDSQPAPGGLLAAGGVDYGRAAEVAEKAPIVATTRSAPLTHGAELCCAARHGGRGEGCRRAVRPPVPRSVM